MAFIGKLGDNQARAYRAEASIMWARFEDLAHVQEFVDSITATEWWTDTYPHVVRVDVVKSLSRTSSMGRPCEDKNSGVIGIAPHDLNLQVVIHEMAHTVTTKSPEGHGAPWAQNFLQITLNIIGRDAYIELKNAFDKEGVAY